VSFLCTPSRAIFSVTLGTFKAPLQGRRRESLVANSVEALAIVVIVAFAGSLLSNPCRGFFFKMAAARLQSLPSNAETIAVTFRMKGLIVCRRAATIAIFSTLLREISIEAQKCESASQALELFRMHRFEALVLDFDEVENCAEVARRVQDVRPNQDISIFAIASDDQNQAAATAAGSTFIVDKTLDQTRIRSLLRSVRGRMLRSFQAYFRLNIEIPVSITRAAGGVLPCVTINLSQNGMAVSAPARLECGESLCLIFGLPPEGEITSAEGTVIWDDGHGRAGIQFHCSGPSATKYRNWLNHHFLLAAQN